MNRSLRKSRIFGALTTLAFVLSASIVRAAPAPTASPAAPPTVPPVGQAPAPIAAIPESGDIGSCSLVPSIGSPLFTPVVLFATPPAIATTVYFNFYDASGKAIGTAAVVVPAPPAFGLPPPLVPFTPPSGFGTVQCTTKASQGAGVPPPSSGSGPNTGLLLGVLGGAGLIGIAAAAGHGGGGGSPSSPSTPAPTPTPTPTPSPNLTPTPTATPTASPTATATPTVAPTSTPTATASPSPSPSPTVSPGALVLAPSSLQFTLVGQTMTTTASETNYSGPYTVSATNCSSTVATINPQTSSSGSFTVTAQGAGGASNSCTFTIAGSAGQSAVLSVGVTTTGGTINARPARAASPVPTSGPAPRR